MAALAGLYLGGKIVALPLQIVSGVITLGETLLKVATVAAKVSWAILKALGEGACFLAGATKDFFWASVSVVQAHPTLATAGLFATTGLGIIFFFKSELLSFARSHRPFSALSPPSSNTQKIITPLDKPKTLVGYGEYGVPIYK